MNQEGRDDRAYWDDKYEEEVLHFPIVGDSDDDILDEEWDCE